MSAGPSSGGSYNSFALFKNGVLQEIIQTTYTDTTPYRQFINAASNPQLTAGVTYYNHTAGYIGSYYQQIQEANVPYNYYAFNYSFLGPYINHGCSFTKNTYCKMNSSPKLCSQNVVSITPTHPVQSVYTNEPLITTVTATYLDGSKKVVLANTTFSTANPITNKVVTLSYQDATGKTLTCSITVNVIPRNKTCVNGHIYNLNNDGSDPECPYCKAWLRSLVIEFPTTPYFNIYRGTTLPENGVTLLATYLDGHTELLESEYIDNLDKNYVGSQSVTMTYKGHYVYLTVVTKRNLKLCTICHRQYELHPDDSDPGCPWCAALTPIFTGNVMQYYDMKYTEEILKELYEGDGIYRFSDDDFLTISVKSKKGSIGTRLLSAIYLNDNVNTIHVIKAGYVREDGYYYRKYK
jgi:glutaredoxin